MFLSSLSDSECNLLHICFPNAPIPTTHALDINLFVFKGKRSGKLLQIDLKHYCKQVTKIGRDAVLYVESLIESIMGGLEGLINILDSEGGFGALEIQVLILKLS